MSTTHRKRKVVYIVSHIDKAIGFEWIAAGLDRNRFEISFILLNDQPSWLANHLREKGIPVTEIRPGGKSRWPLVLLKVMRVLRKTSADVIHTHMYVADIIGQLAGMICGIETRVHTRHSGNENRKYYKRSRINRLIEACCTHILAISENVRNILVHEEKVKPGKIRLIHHGFDLDRFNQVSPEEIAALQLKYNPSGKRPVLGVVARYSHLKGIQYIIDAFSLLLKIEPNAFLILANAKKGDYKDELALQLSSLPPDAYCEIVFEHNLFALYHLFDVYVHVPIDPELEAFGQTYVEALAAGIPSVFTLSGVAREFIVHEKNALVVDFQQAAPIYESIQRLLTDQGLRESMIKQGQSDVRIMFSLKEMIRKLEELYEEGARRKTEERKGS